jgi:hypothetical protein
MRTKSLVAVAALLAAGVASSMAQSVYSLNIVGYVNVNVTNAQLKLLSNPLKPSNGDYNITNTIKLDDANSGGSILYKWNAGTASWDNYDYFTGFGWFPDVNQNLGDGFFIKPSFTQTITLVGEVQTGNSTNTINTGLSLLGSKVPIGGREPGGNVGAAGDIIYTWDGAQWVNFDFFDGFGWFDLADATQTNGPALSVAEGFFYKNTGGQKQWIKTLNP